MLSDESILALQAVGISYNEITRIEVHDYSRVIDHLRKNFSASEVNDRLHEIARYAIDSGRSSHADLYRSSAMPRPSAPVTPDNYALYQALLQLDSIFPQIILDLETSQVPGALIYSAMRHGLLLDRDLIRDWRIKNFYGGLWRYQNTLWFELSKHANSEPMIWQPDDMTLLLLVRYRNQLDVNNSTSWHQYLSRFICPYIGLLRLPNVEIIIDLFQAVLKNYVPSYLVEISANRKKNRSLTRQQFLRLITRRVPHVRYPSAPLSISAGIISRKQKRSSYSNYVSHVIRQSAAPEEFIQHANGQKLSGALRSVIKCAAFFCRNDTQFGTRLKRSGVIRIVNNLTQRFEQLFPDTDPETLPSDQIQESFKDIISSSNSSSSKNLITSLDYYFWYLHNENDRALVTVKSAHASREQNWLYPSMVMPWEYLAIKNLLHRKLKLAEEPKDKFIISRMILAVMLGYRSGLRRGEILSLRYRDIQLEGIPTIVISTHGKFKPKTLSGNRVVIVGGRYSDDEMNTVRGLMSTGHQNVSIDERQIFSGYLQLSDSTNNKNIFDEISHIIRFVTGDENASFHSLRHSFASLNVYRMIRSRFSASLPVIDYVDCDTGEDYSVYLNRLAPLPGATRRVNPVYQISAEMGHASPETTLGTYVHSLDWVFPYYQRRMMPTFSTAQLAEALGVSRQAIQKTVKANGGRNLADYRDMIVRKLKPISTNVDLSDWTEPKHRLRLGNYNRNFEFDGCVSAIKRYRKKKISLRQLITLYPKLLDFPHEILRDSDLINHFARLHTNNQKIAGDNIIQRFSDLVPSEQRYCFYRWGISRDEWNSGGLNKPRLIFESKRTEKAYNYLAKSLKVFDSAEIPVVSG
ncbi:tyrosine-type recombinase/integrase [Thalassolituus hydrocarboniclasticus]|uniref:Tyrosine-type recombinase/integrase n=1 Tax=Thalassolituus hydrocarboniclasticus TaxID=2742796 RepID=A0ABY6ADU3_9GAMM|nr:tyrosine-type recombinase/integrase [Thalassolituus hydrocarboniclasticus]UXD88952.1 tyrosine-type recombinase/integrase [Thalassolituus hydrocarboniclasticus]